MRTVVVTRDGEQKLRVPAEIRNGILRNGDNILINSDLIEQAGLTKDYVAAEIKAKRITPQIESLGMHIGDNGNGLVCRWADEIEAEHKAKKAKELWGRELRVSGHGKLVIIHDVRDDLSDSVVYAGCRWTVTGTGKSFSLGSYGHQVRYAYVAFAEITDGREAYANLTSLLADEQERYRREFNAMMDDEYNDSVNPPREVCGDIQTILNQISKPDVDAVQLRNRVERAADTDPSTKTGYIRRKYGKKALELLNSGAEATKVDKILNAYEDDPEYADAVLGM